jgi:uncharacterized protein with NRDE domain
MCLVAVLYQVVEDAPLIIGANREEFFARGGEPPRLLDGRAVAGIDPVGGGTWLGVNRHGLLVAVTNRRKVPPPQPRSRGLLTRDLLGCAGAAEAIEAARRELTARPYAGCNFLCADAEDAFILHAGDALDVRPLSPGIHVLTNRDINDPNDPRIREARRWLASRSYRCHQQALTALEELCSSCGGDAPAICYQDGERGTVSSSLIALRRPLRTSVYLHAQGPPDRTPYRDYSPLLQELTERRSTS